MNQSRELCITDGLRTHFCPFLGPFCPKSQKREFSQIWDFCRKLANHNTLHFRSFLAKTNDSILHKSQKNLFLGHFCPFLRKWEFSRKIRLCHFSTFMVPILRTLRHWQKDRLTDRRQWIHRTFHAKHTWSNMGFMGKSCRKIWVIYGYFH